MHRPQCRNDLWATGKFLCLLINFRRPKIEIRRIAAEAGSRTIPFIPAYPANPPQKPTAARNPPPLEQ
jgi:hypothetical protein